MLVQGMSADTPHMEGSPVEPARLSVTSSESTEESTSSREGQTTPAVDGVTSLERVPADLPDPASTAPRDGLGTGNNASDHREPRAAAVPRLAPRRVNPYLTSDPAQKARRLARALVSDLVAYQPEKREEGLRAGTLKDLFRDDVRKSWQEYVEQVGAQTAESTPHFQDALNDILAGGRRVF